jgi:hypothetical protein
MPRDSVTAQTICWALLAAVLGRSVLGRPGEGVLRRLGGLERYLDIGIATVNRITELRKQIGLKVS